MSEIDPYYPNYPNRALMTDQRAVDGVVLALAWVCAVITAGYLLPWAVAATRGRANQAAIGVINLLLGWSLIGWIVALVMACQSHSVLVVGGYAPVVGGYAPVVGGYAPVSGGYAPPPDWYPAPNGHGQEYWDGTVWTGHRAP